MEELAHSGVALEVCPGSNVAMGVFAHPSEVPLRALAEHGIPIALGADDPLLFGSRLVAQYELARDHLAFTDAELARLASQSLAASRAPESVRTAADQAAPAWLATHGQRQAPPRPPPLPPGLPPRPRHPPLPPPPVRSSAPREDTPLAGAAGSMKQTLGQSRGPGPSPVHTLRLSPAPLPPLRS